ncbi:MULTISPECIES: flagellar biosynthetic protein FliO [unclassified Janthinobacterium]|uniref:flagellar biosynthetic protein FliO n=1 Tax=unclassified Janthinobacterium TaxID=2610881 RepID=UPI001E32B011|nr:MULTISPECIES: flagellar biosynthetic protein FliO [unclassified Janthinobacterium]MEC5162267.1 flagellar protein FliO/FliZ [Janthinobacterium sp. CG_S6]
MKPVAFIAMALACCIANATANGAATPAAPFAAVPATPPSSVSAPAPAPSAAATPDPAPVPAPEALAMPGRAVAPAPAPIPAATATAPASAAGSLLQTILALLFVLALLGGLAWFMKRFGPKVAGGNSRLRLLSSMSLGGRERVMLIEVGDQWIVVGASPGRVNALATMPRQDDASATAGQPNSPAAANFSEWLKQTIEKRNGK